MFVCACYVEKLKEAKGTNTEKDGRKMIEKNDKESIPDSIEHRCSVCYPHHCHEVRVRNPHVADIKNHRAENNSND